MSQFIIRWQIHFNPQWFSQTFLFYFKCLCVYVYVRSSSAGGGAGWCWRWSPHDSTWSPGPPAAQHRGKTPPTNTYSPFKKLPTKQLLFVTAWEVMWAAEERSCLSVVLFITLWNADVTAACSWLCYNPHTLSPPSCPRLHFNSLWLLVVLTFDLYPRPAGPGCAAQKTGCQHGRQIRYRGVPEGSFGSCLVLNPRTACCPAEGAAQGQTHRLHVHYRLKDHMQTNNTFTYKQ